MRIREMMTTSAVLPLVMLATQMLCHAQSPALSSPTVSSESDTVPVSLPPSQREIAEIFIRSGSGEAIPLSDLLGPGIVDEILERATQQRSIPRYTTARLELEGVIERFDVRLDVTMQVQVHVSSEWVTVPLMFGDMYITGLTGSTDAEDGQSLFTTGEGHARQAHLRGAGLHTIRVQLIGKGRSVSPGVAQLSTILPAATASYASFRFGIPVEIQKLPQGAVERTTRDELGVRKVEFWGLGSATSFSWSEVVTRVAQKPIIHVQNRMKLDLTTIPVTLTGTQMLQISGSPVSELRVTFPAGFQLVEADARNAAGVSVLSNFESATSAGTSSSESSTDSAAGPSMSTAVIRLTSAIEGTLSLAFDLELVNRQFPQDIRVTMPTVADANLQPGDLDIVFPTGLFVQQSELTGVQRIRVTAETSQNVASTAFRMRSSESAIVLHVEETEAQFAVSPELTLQPDGQNLLMTARYPVSVLKGSLLDLAIVWPGYSSLEWQILPGSMRLTGEVSSLPLTMTVSESDPDMLLLTFPERQSGSFTVEFRAFSSLQAARAGALTRNNLKPLISMPLNCPEVAGRRGQPVVLTTIESDQFSVRPISMTSGELLPSVPLRDSGRGISAESDLKSESWLLDDPSTPIRLELPEQAPSVRANLVVGLNPQASGIEVHERIRFEIEHRDMSSLSLQVPDQVRPVVRVAGHSEPLRATIESSSWTFRLPESRRGRLEVDVIYLWTAPLEAAQLVDHIYQLPVILPQSAEIQSIQVGTGALSGIRVHDNNVWMPVYSDAFDAAVETTKSVSTIPVRWHDRRAEASSISPELIVARTQIVGNQTVTSMRAVYSELPEFIDIETADDMKLESIRLAGELLTGADADRSFMESRRLTDRRMIRWTIAAKKFAEGLTSLPILEVRLRENLSAERALWQTALFRRAMIVGESSAVPVVWCFGSQDAFRSTPASPAYTALSGQITPAIPGLQRNRNLTDQYLQAVLSPFLPDVQTEMTRQVEEWIGESGHHELYFGSVDSGALELHLIPGVSLLLVSALTCVFWFILLSVFRQMSAIVPLLLTLCLGLTGWLMVPEHTRMLAPYVAAGVLIGLVAVIFQRLTGNRTVSGAGVSRVTGMPAVFGYSGSSIPLENEDSGAGIRTGSSVVAPSRPMDVSVGSGALR